MIISEPDIYEIQRQQCLNCRAVVLSGDVQGLT